MARFSVDVHHHLDREDSGLRLRTFADRVREDLPGGVEDVRESWDDAGNVEFSFRAWGFAVSGRMENRAGLVHVSGTIPLAALPFRGMIEREIRNKVLEALETVP